METHRFDDLDEKSPLVNSAIPSNPTALDFAMSDRIRVQVMDAGEIEPRVKRPKAPA